MSLEKKDILAEERRTGKRLLGLRRQYNRSVLSGGGNTFDISCKIDPDKKIRIKGYEKYDVYECKDKNKKILQDYKMKQLYKRDISHLEERIKDMGKNDIQTQIIRQNLKKVKELEKRNEILKDRLLNESNNSYQLHGELIKMRQDNEEYRNRVLKFYEKMEKHNQNKRDAIMKGREEVLKQTFEQNIKKVMRKHIQDAEEAMMQYYIKKMDDQEKYHEGQTKNHLDREEELLKQLEDVKAQLKDANDAWSKYSAHIVETTQREIEEHKKKRKRLEEKIEKLLPYYKTK